MTAGFQPGAAPFGNFINYYSFNPPEKRINFIPTDLVHIICGVRTENMTVLDIGCNAGNLTVALYDHLISEKETENDKEITTKDQTQSLRKAQNGSVQINVLGCDIDDQLIRRANESNPHPSNILFLAMDFMCDTSRNTILTDFTSDKSKANFDLACCFSVTMWIHLQHGDAGLRKLLREVSAVSRFLLIEPQPWKCYKSALRRVKKLGVDNKWQFDNLEIREEVDEQIEKYLLLSCSMELVRTLGETHWDRRLLLFRKIQS